MSGRGGAAAAGPGVVGTARVGAVADVAGRVGRGDVVVLDQTDLDAATAQALVAAGVVAVVNARRLATGRYANLGPRVLADAGVVWVDDVGAAALHRVRDGARLRVADGDVLEPDGRLLGSGHVLDLLAVRAAVPVAGGLAALPELGVRVEGRPALVVGDVAHADLRRVTRFVRRQGPVVVAVGRSAVEDLAGLSWRPDVVVLPPDDPDADPPADPAADPAVDSDAARAARPGAGGELGLGPGVDVVTTAESPDDVAALLVGRDGATVVVTLGLTVGDAVRVRLGSRLVDAAALGLVDPGSPSRRRWLLAGVLALITAVGVVLDLTVPDLVAGLVGDLVDQWHRLT